MSKKEAMPYPFQVSDESVNTYGIRVLTSGGRFDRFIANPVILNSHRDDQVIGRGENLRSEGSTIFCDVVFDSEDPEAAKIEGKVKRNFIRMASLGIIPQRVILDSAMLTDGEPTPTVTNWELREISITPFGSNLSALAMYDQNGQMLNLNDRTAILKLCDKADNSPLKTNTKSMKKVIELLKLSDESSEDQVVAAVKKLTADHEELAKNTLELSDKNKALEEQLADFAKKEAEAKSAEAISLTDQAIKDGRINAEAKESYLKLFDTDHDAAKAALNAITKRSTLATSLGANQPAKGFADKGWDELHKLGKLEELKMSDPGLFAQKFEAKFGKKPKNQ